MIYMTSEEAGRAVGVSSAFIRYLARKGDLPNAATTGRGVYLFDPSVVSEFAKNRERDRKQPRANYRKVRKS